MQNAPFFVVRFPLASFAVRVDEDLEAGNETPRCSENDPIGPGRLTRGRVCMNDVARRPRKVLSVLSSQPAGSSCIQRIPSTRLLGCCVTDEAITVTWKGKGQRVFDIDTQLQSRIQHSHKEHHVKKRSQAEPQPRPISLAARSAPPPPGSRSRPVRKTTRQDTDTVDGAAAGTFVRP